MLISYLDDWINNTIIIIMFQKHYKMESEGEILDLFRYLVEGVFLVRLCFSLHLICISLCFRWCLAWLGVLVTSSASSLSHRNLLKNLSTTWCWSSLSLISFTSSWPSCSLVCLHYSLSKKSSIYIVFTINFAGFASLLCTPTWCRCCSPWPR